MDIMLDEQEQDLSKILCVRDKDGRTVVTIGLLATFFFKDPVTRAVREAVAEIAEDYISLVREYLKWARHPKTVQTHPIDARRVKFPKQWLPEHPDGKTWEFSFHGGETKVSASEFHVGGFGAFDPPDGGLGFLHVSLPLLWFAKHSSTFPELVLKICKRLKPFSGYAGVGVLESPSTYTGEEFQSVVCQIAERFPGLEIESWTAHTLWLNEGIKGVNWLTILGDHWVAEMGGLSHLRACLDASFGFYPYEGGLIIQAGPKPQIGDVQTNRWPRHYVTLAKTLKRIQIKEHCPFHFGGLNRMDHETSKAWLFRFDGK